jgi:hypothetical protein
VLDADLDYAELVAAESCEQLWGYGGMRSHQFREDPLHHVSPEGLEAAVDVARLEPQRCLRNVIPAATHDPPVYAIGPLKSESDRSICERVLGSDDQVINICRMKLSIGIAECDPRIACLERGTESASKRRSVALILVVPHYLKSAMPLGQARCNVGGVVVAAIVDDDQRIRASSRLQVFDRCIRNMREILALVMRWQKHCDAVV